MRVVRTFSVLIALLGLGALAACGDDSSDSSSAQSTGSSTSADASAQSKVVDPDAKPATGTPIKVGLIAPSSGPIAYPGIAAAAKGAVIGANQRGGLGGRPIELVVCDEASNPNKALACARRLVSEGVVAAVSTLSPGGEQGVIEVLGKAKIPQIGTYAFAGAASDPYNFPTIVQAVGNAGTASLAEEAGKKVSLVSLDIPISAAYAEFFGNIARKNGQDFLGVTKVPLTASDGSSYAGSALSKGPDVVELLATSQIVTQVGLAAIQQGFKGKFVSVSSMFATDEISNFKQAFPLWTAAAFFPPVDTKRFPEYATFKTDMQAAREAGEEAAPTGDGYVQDQTINGWFSVMALQKIANEAGATTAAEITEAFRNAKDVDLGIIPPWTPNAEGPPGLPRASNPYVWATKFEGDNTAVLAQDEPIDVTPILEQVAK